MGILTGLACGAVVSYCTSPLEQLPLAIGERISNMASKSVADAITDEPTWNNRVRIVTKVAIAALVLTALAYGGSTAAVALKSFPFLKGFVSWLIFGQMCYFFIKPQENQIPLLSFYTAVYPEERVNFEDAAFGAGRFGIAAVVTALFATHFFPVCAIAGTAFAAYDITVKCATENGLLPQVAQRA